MPDQNGRLTPEELESLYAPVRKVEPVPSPVPVTTHERTLRPGLLPHVAALGTRTGGGIISGIVGAAPSIFTTPAAAAIGGVAEAAAQKMESPDPLDKSTIGVEAGLSAIPLGKVFTAGKTAGKQLLGNVLRGAGLNEVGNMLRRFNSSGNILPGSMREAGMDLLTSLAGAGGGYLANSSINARVAQEAAARAAEQRVIDEMRNVPNTGGKLVPNSVGLRVKPNAPVENLALAVKGRVVKNPIGNARTITEPAQIAGGVEGKQKLIANRPSKINPEKLDSDGIARRPDAVLQGLDEEIKKAADMAEVQRKAHEKVRSEETKLVKAEQNADKENLRNRQGATDIGKVKVAEDKAQAAALKERVEAEKAHTAANALVTEENRVQAAQDKIDAMLGREDVEVGEPSITESTVRVPTDSGSQTMRQTIRIKPPQQEDPFAGVDFDSAPRGPLPVAPTGKPVIPKTNPDVVAKTIYPNEMAAMDALAGSGRPGIRQHMGRGKWRVIFEPVEGEAPKPVAAEPVAEAPVAKTEPVSVPETDRAKIEADVNAKPVQEPPAPPVEPPAAPVPVKPAPKGPKPSPAGAAAKPVEAPQKPVAPSAAPKKGAVPVQGKSASVAPAKAPAEAPSAPARKSPLEMRKAEIDAATREDVKSWTPDELNGALAKFPKDKRLATIINDELKNRAAAAPKPPDTPPPAEPTPVPVKLKGLKPAPPTKTQAAAPKAEPVKPAGYKDSYEKMAVESSLPEGAVKVDLTGAADAKEVRQRVINELEKYRQEVARAEETKGVNEKGEYTYGTPLPKPLTVHVPGGPTYTIKPDQVNNAIERLEKGLTAKGYAGGGTPTKINPDEAFKGIVDPTPRPTAVKVSTGYGGPPVKLSLAPIRKTTPASSGPTSGPTVSTPAGATKRVRPTSILDEPKPAAPAKAPETPAQPLPTDINDLAMAEKVAWDKYWDLKKSKADPAEIRAAGKAAGELKYALAEANKKAQAEGKPQVPFAQAPEPKAKVKAPAGKGPTNEDIAALPPDKQEQALTEIVSKFNKGRKKLNESGAVDAALLSRIGLAGAGALAGAATTPDNPIVGAMLGASAGFYAPSVFRTLAKQVASSPQNSPSRLALGKSVYEYVAAFADLVPDFYRASYLSKPDNLLFNAWAGPYGAGVMGMLERAVTGDRRAIGALKELTKSFSFLKEWFGPSMKEARQLVFSAEERGDMIGKGPSWWKEIISAPATGMTAGDVAIRRILMKHGFSELEARQLTLTSEPVSGAAKAIGNARKTKGPSGKQSWVMQMALPFYRTNANQIEQSLLRTPIGPILRNTWKLAPQSVKLTLAQNGITGGVAAGGYALGAMTPKDKQPRMLKFLTNFAGPYGVTAGIAFAAGAISQRNDKVSDQWINGTMQYLRNGLPLPTADFFISMLDSGKALMRGEFKLPYGTIPAPLSSKEQLSIPTLERLAMGDKEASRPTKKEYSIAVPFIKDPELKPKSKSDIEIELEQIKKELSDLNKDQEMADEFRRLRQETRDAQR